MKLGTYVFFDGDCEEAIHFYERVLGARVEMLMRNRDNPEPPPPGSLPEGSDDKILHCSLRIGDTSLMLSDGRCASSNAFQGFSLCITQPDDAETRRVFDALAEGGEVKMPLAKTFWSPCFGMLTDRFGVLWALDTEA